jgi:hexosaminidase
MKRITWVGICLISISVHAQQQNIIPQPVDVKINSAETGFKLTATTKIVLGPGVQKNFSDYLNLYLKKNYGITLSVTSQYVGSNFILLRVPSTKEIIADVPPPPPPPPMEPGEEHDNAYHFHVDNLGISIWGDSKEGLFSALQTLIQLLPTENKKPFTATIPSMNIADYPHFKYRGMHLDVGRHFFPVSFIKKYIDYLALHKFNYFHWHLTEDQGWRIEIKKYPQLTKVGAWRNGTITGRYPGTGSDNKPYGGFYTQAEVKEVVKYAADRFITVIPEIEMPGHSSAAIASYPYLSCFSNEPTKIPANMISKKSVGQQKNGRVKLVQETWGVFDDVFCAGKDSTFKFLQDVMDEVLALFPSKYIHVGGDESPKANWKRCPLCQKRIKDEGLKDEHELQSYFIQRIEKYLNSKGRTLIGWDEILEGGLAPNAVVMSWRGEEGGIAAAKENHDVIMTPGGWCYFDHSQSQNEDSVTIGGYTSIEKVYSYNPVPGSLTEEQGKHILGAQGNVWTEYMKNTRKVEYMIFPRTAALSEVLWSQKKDSADFERRLLTQFKRYDLWKANYSKAYFDLKVTVIPKPNFDGIAWQLESKNDKAQIIYMAAENDNNFEVYKKPIDLVSIGYSAALAEKKQVGYKILSNWIIQNFHLNKATGKKINLTTPPAQNYPGDGAFTLVNGVWNEKGLARSTEFLGFNGTDCESTIDLGSMQQISNVKAHVFEQTPSWIWRPKYFQVLISPDDKTYTEMGMTDQLKFTDAANRNAVMTVQQKSVAARYIKIRLGNFGTIPDGNPGAGNKPWLFVDEIEVN